jgi:Glycosyltransferases involved in cell wall biogenesis
MKVSIAMAVYNGEKYISRQINSILSQTFTNFELVISDDNSTDGTVEICRNFQIKDSRITLVKNSGKRGFVSNFFNALSYCRGDLFFLSDQDDIWVNTKIERMIESQKKTNADLLIHDLQEFSDEKELKYSLSNSKDEDIEPLSFYTVFSQCSYPGLVMCFTQQLYCKIIEQYNFFTERKLEIPSHDWMISLYASLNGKVYHSSSILLYHRRHENNVTKELRDETTVNTRLHKIAVLKKHFFFAKMLISNRNIFQHL